MKIALTFFAALALGALPLLGEEAKPPASAPATAVKDVTSEEAAKLLRENPKVVVLDVRTPEEFAKGHIPGAKNVDFLGDDFAAGVKAFDPQTPILLHCASGGRSAQALDVLKGKQVIYHLKDGFKAWEKAGKPVEK